MLKVIDSEGRVLVTDHGHFVLFNVYAPCIRYGPTLNCRMCHGVLPFILKVRCDLALLTFADDILQIASRREKR